MITRDTQTGKLYAPALRRLKYRWILWRDSNNELSRRVEVEMFLWNCASGKKPLPDKEQCRKLARKLGIKD